MCHNGKFNSDSTDGSENSQHFSAEGDSYPSLDLNPVEPPSNTKERISRLAMFLMLLAFYPTYMIFLGKEYYTRTDSSETTQEVQEAKINYTEIEKEELNTELEDAENSIIEHYEANLILKATQTIEATPLKTPSHATKLRPFVNSLNMHFVPIPSEDHQKIILSSIWETRRIDYETYAADREKTPDDWRKISYETIPVSPNDLHPVVKVSWQEARDFCVWLTAKEIQFGHIPQGTYYRLPKDHEWSIAVGIGEQEIPTLTPMEKSEKIKDIYPWGNVFPPNQRIGNYADLSAKQKFKDWKSIPQYQDDHATTAPVGSYPPNFLGLYDLGGNVWEWCEDMYDASNGDARVIRGASWDFSLKHTLSSSFRGSARPETKDAFTGFRVVLVLNQRNPDLERP